jgi:four helix bundle protein
MDLVIETYKVTSMYSSAERFGLTAQTRRSSVSIPSNIAEGYARRRRAEYLRYIDIAYGSTAELETQLIAAKRLGFLASKEHHVFELQSEVERMLASLRRRLAQPPSEKTRSLDPSIP